MIHGITEIIIDIEKSYKRKDIDDKIRQSLINKVKNFIEFEIDEIKRMYPLDILELEDKNGQKWFLLIGSHVQYKMRRRSMSDFDIFNTLYSAFSHFINTKKFKAIPFFKRFSINITEPERFKIWAIKKLKGKTLVIELITAY